MLFYQVATYGNFFYPYLKKKTFGKKKLNLFDLGQIPPPQKKGKEMF